MVEIASESSLRDGGLEIRVRGADQPDVGRLGTCATQSAYRPLLDHRQELGLHGLGEQADLIEEEHAAVRGLKETGLGLTRIREGPAFEAEELGFEECLRNSGAVDVHEGRQAADAVTMKHVGGQPLAGAGFALEEDRRQALTRCRASSRRSLSPTACMAGLSPSGSTNPSMTAPWSKRLLSALLRSVLLDALTTAVGELKSLIIRTNLVAFDVRRLSADVQLERSRKEMRDENERLLTAYRPGLGRVVDGDHRKSGVRA